MPATDANDGSICTNGIMPRRRTASAYDVWNRSAQPLK